MIISTAFNGMYIYIGLMGRMLANSPGTGVQSQVES